MMVGKFVSKIIQSLPSWEVTKYYGRVAWFQLQCLKYRFQTSETWFNFMNKFMPGRLKQEAEYEDETTINKCKQVQGKKQISETRDETSESVPKSVLLKEKLEKLRKKKDQQDVISHYDEEQRAVKTCTESDKKKKENLSDRSKPKSKK